MLFPPVSFPTERDFSARNKSKDSEFVNITKENIHFYEHKKQRYAQSTSPHNYRPYFYLPVADTLKKRLFLQKTHTMNNHKNLFLCAAAVALLTACANNEKDIAGTWMQPSGLPGIEQGFTLEEGGKAASVNMATLQYEAWQLQGSSLILTGKSIGNGQTIAFADTLEIKLLTQDSLKLKRGTLTLAFARKEAGKQEAAPATEIFPASGTLIIGPEVRSFQPDGDPNTYWIVDRTGTLYQKYDCATGGTKNGIPVHARLQVEDLGKSADGFARDYPSVYAVHRIDTLYKGE